MEGAAAVTTAAPPLASYHTPAGGQVDVHPIERAPGRNYRTHCVCRACGEDVPHRGENRARLTRDAKRWARTHSYTCPA